VLLLGAYKIPGFNDIPQVFNVSLLREADWPNLGTIASSKGVGEPPLFLGASVAFAIRDALASARRDAGIHELQPFRSPLTCERIRLAVGDDLLKRGMVVNEGQQSFFADI
jgi:xanthine dehydrogenase/oxidase